MSRVKHLAVSPPVLIGAVLALVVTATVSVLLINRADAVRYDAPTATTQTLPASLMTVAGEIEAESNVHNAVGFSNGTVSITRSASVSVEADHAILDLGVEAIGATVASARQAAAERMTAMLDAMEEAGIEDDDIATSMFEIYPQTEWVEIRTEIADADDVVTNRSQIVGYAVRNGIKVTVRELDSVGPVIDAAAEAAGDLFRVPGIRFGASNQDDAVDQARVLASRDARRVAELHAITLGFVLGPVVEMVEYGGAAPLGAQFDARVETAQALSFDTPIVPGDIDVSATVQVKFAILGAVAAPGQ